MNITIKATQMELTEVIRSHAYKCAESVQKVLGENVGSVSAQVEVAKTTNHHQSGDIFRAEINMKIDGTLLRATSEKSDILAALDDVKDEIVREVLKMKDKKRSFLRKGGQKTKAFIKSFFK